MYKVIYGVLVSSMILIHPAYSDTIENFEIINSSTLTTDGGEFTSGGTGTYSGSFSLDISQVASIGTHGSFSIGTPFDITLTGALPEEFSSADGTTTGGYFVSQTINAGPAGVLDTAGIVTLVLENSDAVFFMTLAEPLDTFSGGLVLYATEETNNGSAVSDSTGSAPIVDPAPGDLLPPRTTPMCGPIRLDTHRAQTAKTMLVKRLLPRKQFFGR